jgi:carbon storage regulator CsrA
LSTQSDRWLGDSSPHFQPASARSTSSHAGRGYFPERKKELGSTHRTAKEANGVCARFFNPISSRRAAKMLVLSRKFGESVVIDGGITVTVLKVKGNVVQLGIDAPREVSIRRSELRKLGQEFELPMLV